MLVFRQHEGCRILPADSVRHLGLPASLTPCSIVGKRADSRTVQNKLTDVVANANRGDYRVRVRSVQFSAAGLEPCFLC